MIDGQLALDAGTLARSGDTATSHRGADYAAATAPERVALFCYALHRIGGEGTANEVAAHLVDRLEWVHWSAGPWKRASDCHKLDLIRPELMWAPDRSVHDDELVPVVRPCKVTGRNAQVWELMATGRDLAACIRPNGVGSGGDPKWIYTPKAGQQ